MGCRYRDPHLAEGKVGTVGLSDWSKVLGTVSCEGSTGSQPVASKVHALCSVAVQGPQKATVLEGRGWVHGEVG